jgi:hypothetical protein
VDEKQPGRSGAEGIERASTEVLVSQLNRIE